MTNGNQSVGDVYIYRIDASDRINYLSNNWNAFAEDNYGTNSCFAPAIHGSLVWDHIQGDETRHLYHLMVQKVRANLKPVKVPIRCDAPNLKRHINVTLKPGHAGAVTFENKIVGLEFRPAVDLLDSSHPRSKELIRICSYCKKIDMGHDQWVNTETAVANMELFNYTRLPQLTHTVCLGCYQMAMDTLKNL